MAAEQYPRLRRVPDPPDAETSGDPHIAEATEATGEAMGIDLFSVDDITLGPHAHGFGTAEDGRPFSFRVVEGTMTLRVYRDDLDSTVVPSGDDVTATARARVSDVDLSDERSVVAMVRDMLTHVEPHPQADAGNLLGRLIGWLLGRPE